jgi:hypothetical protein
MLLELNARKPAQLAVKVSGDLFALLDTVL